MPVIVSLVIVAFVEICFGELANKFASYCVTYSLIFLWNTVILENILTVVVCAVDPTFNRGDEVFQYFGNHFTHMVDLSATDLNAKIVSFIWFLFFVFVLHILCTLTKFAVVLYTKAYTNNPNDTPDEIPLRRSERLRCKSRI